MAALVLLIAAATACPASAADLAPPDELYSQATRHYAAGEWQPAAEAFARFVQQNPQHDYAAEAQFYGSEALVRQQLYALACERLVVFLAVWPDNRLTRVARFRHGECLFLSDKPTEAAAALTAFQRDFATDPLNAFVLSYLGDMALAANDLPAARGFYLQGLQSFPESSIANDCRFGLGSIYKTLGQPAAARTEFELVARQHEDELADDAQLELALLDYEGGDFAGAEQRLLAFRTTFKPSELRGQAEYWLGMSQLGGKRLKDACATLSAAAAEFSASLEAAALTFAAAEAYRLTGEHIQAGDWYRAVTERFPDSEWADDALAVQLSLAVAAGDFALADKLCRQASQKFPGSTLAVDALVARGKSLELDLRGDAAISVYQLIANHFAASTHAASCLFASAQLHERLEHHRDAATLLSRLVSEHPQFGRLDEALHLWAWALRDLNEHAAADAIFARLHAEFPQSHYWAAATYALAESAARKQQVDQALRLTSALLESQADTTIIGQALYLRGQLAANAGKWDDVDANMRELIKQCPKHPLRFSADFWLAEAAYRRGQFAAAAALLTQLESESAKRDEPWLAMIPLRRAQLLAQDKQWAEALRIATAIQQRFPEFRLQYEVDFVAGRCLGSLGRYDEARAAYARVIELPNAKATETAAMAQWMIGETFFREQRHAEAIAAYQRCATQHTHAQWQAAALLQAGKCRQLLGDDLAAKSLYAKTASDFGQTPAAIEAGERLETLNARSEARISTRTR